MSVLRFLSESMGYPSTCDQPPPLLEYLLFSYDWNGSTGRSMDHNRFIPGCKQEALWLGMTLRDVTASGNFVGTQVPIVVTDPYYPDGQWIKIQALGVIQDRSSNDPNYMMERKINIHYMYNVATHQVHQIKFKNSWESGCVGFKVRR